MNKGVLQKNIIRALNSCEFNNAIIPMGVDKAGNFVYENYSKMNNIFVCGAASTGKSVFLGNILISLTKQLDSSKLDIIIVDIKRVEFLDLKSKGYRIVTDYNETVSICEDLAVEMERRRKLFVGCQVKNIEEYNKRNKNDKLKHIVVIFDEFGDLIYEDNTIYESLLKVAQSGILFGIHFIVSTQSPYLLKRAMIKNNMTAHIGIDFLDLFTTRVSFPMSSEEDSVFVIKSKAATELKGIGDAVVILSDKRYQIQTPYISHKILLESIRDNNCEAIEYSKEENVYLNSLSKIVIINFTKQGIENKLSKYLCQYSEVSNLFRDSKKSVLKDTDILCFIYDNESDLMGDEVKNFIQYAKGCDIDILFFNTENKKIDEIVMLLNEISKLVCEHSLINIDIKDIKWKNIIDAFVVTKELSVDLKKEYIQTVKKYFSKVPNVNQVIISVSGGRNTRLDEIYDYVDIIKNSLPRNVNVIFGSNITKQYSGVNKVGVILQCDSKEDYNNQMIKYKDPQEFEGIKENDYMSIKETKDEIYNKKSCKTPIEKLSMLDKISSSVVQRYINVGYSKAVELIDKWERNGAIIKAGKFWTIVDPSFIINDLKEIY